MSQQRRKSTEHQAALPIDAPAPRNAGKTILIDTPQEHEGATAEAEGRPDAPPDAPCDRGWTAKNGSSILNETMQWMPVSDPQKPPPSYQPVLPYGEIAKLVRRYRQIMPKSTYDALDEFAEALEYAVAGVKDRNSECSHFDGADISFCAVMDATEDLPYDTTQFVATLAQQLADTTEVLKDGDDPSGKPSLRDPGGQLARILREQERRNKRLPPRSR